MNIHSPPKPIYQFIIKDFKKRRQFISLNLMNMCGKKSKHITHLKKTK